MRAVLGTYSRLLEDVRALRNTVLDSMKKQPDRPESGARCPPAGKAAGCTCECNFDRRGAAAREDTGMPNVNGTGASPLPKKSRRAISAKIKKPLKASKSAAFSDGDEAEHGGTGSLAGKDSEGSSGRTARGGRRRPGAPALQGNLSCSAAESPQFEIPSFLDHGKDVSSMQKAAPALVQGGPDLKLNRTFSSQKSGPSGRKRTRALLFSSQLLKNNSYRTPISVGHESQATAPKQQYSYSFFKALEMEVQEL